MPTKKILVFVSFVIAGYASLNEATSKHYPAGLPQRPQ